jgi:hypothetical protein
MRDFFYLSLEAVSRKIDETISNTSIKRLVDYNYGVDSQQSTVDSQGPKSGNHKSQIANQKLPYPKLVTSNIVVINPLELLEVAKDVGKFDVDLLQPDNDTENWIRNKCGMPLKSKTSRPRWAPIQTRLEEQEEGAVPVEPGATPEPDGEGSARKTVGSEQESGRGGSRTAPTPDFRSEAQVGTRHGVSLLAES